MHSPLAYLGPVAGPVAGGFLAQTVGVRYVFIVIAGMEPTIIIWHLAEELPGVSGFASAIGIPLLRETYAPVIRMRIALKQGDHKKAADVHPLLLKAEGGILHVLWINLERPVIILFGSSICFILSLYMALWVCSASSTFPECFWPSWVGRL